MGQAAPWVRPAAWVKSALGPGFPNRLHYLLDRRLEKEKEFLGHGPAIHLHRELPTPAGDHFYFDAWFLPQRLRHTGGMRLGAASDRALANRYLLHS